MLSAEHSGVLMSNVLMGGAGQMYTCWNSFVLGRRPSLRLPKVRGLKSASSPAVPPFSCLGSSAPLPPPMVLGPVRAGLCMSAPLQMPVGNALTAAQHPSGRCKVLVTCGHHTAPKSSTKPICAGGAPAGKQQSMCSGASQLRQLVLAPTPSRAWKCAHPMPGTGTKPFPACSPCWTPPPVK